MKNLKIIKTVIIAIAAFMATLSYYKGDTGNTIVYCMVLFLLVGETKIESSNSKKDK